MVKQFYSWIIGYRIKSPSLVGLEPTTSGLEVRRAIHCATETVFLLYRWHSNYAKDMNRPPLHFVENRPGQLFEPQALEVFNFSLYVSKVGLFPQYYLYSSILYIGTYLLFH